MMKNTLSILLMATLITSSAFADNNHGTHVSGTIGATGNNGTTSGGSGRDILIGGTGTDLSRPAPTGTVTFFVNGTSVVASAVQILMTIR